MATEGATCVMCTVVVALLITVPQLALVRAQNQGCEQADIALVIDSSSSISTNIANWMTMKNFLKQIVDRLNIGSDRVRVGVVNYAGQTIIEFFMNDFTSREQLKIAIDNIQPIGTSTATHTALAALRTRFFQRNDRPLINNVAILFTDGGSSDPFQTETEARLAKESGIRMLVVGVTNNVDVDELRAIASNPIFDVFQVDNFESLVDVLDNIVQTACTAEILPNQCDIGDIALILDGSTSIVYEGYSNWYNVMLGFAEDLITAFGVSQNGSHWGLVIFSDQATMEFPLDAYYSQEDMTAFIRAIPHPGGETNIVDGLRKAQLLFSPLGTTVTANGDRPNVKNMAFLITDGQANVEWRQLPAVANATRDQGIEIFCVGITNDTNEEQLRQIASTPSDEHVFLVSDFEDLRREIVAILAKACETTTAAPTTAAPTTEPATDPPTTDPTTAAPTTAAPTTAAPTTAAPTTAAPTTAAPTPPTPAPPTPAPPTPAPPTPASELPITTTYSPVICDGEGADLVFIIDGSGSINELNFKKILEFVSDVIWRVDVEGGKVKIGVMTFSDRAEIVFHLDRFSTRGSMVSAVKGVRYLRQTTNTADALNVLRSTMFTQSRGDRPNIQNIAVIVTDGESNDKDATLREAVDAKTAGIRVLTVGIGSWLDVNELQNMASYPHERNMYHVQRFDALAGLTDTLRDYICTNNLACSSNPCQNSGRCINKPNSYECICNPPFTGATCQDVCREPADIVIAMDASGSIGKSNFRIAIDFMTTVVQGFDVDNAVGSSGTRLGFMTFADNAVKKFDLNQYNNKQQILEALSIMYTGGTTNTADAIRYARENMFTPRAGDRSGVPNYLIVLTDGRANDPDAAWSEAMQARNGGIQILAIGIGQGINRFELESIASQPAEKNVLVRRDFTTLDELLRREIYTSICNNNPVCSTRPCMNGAPCTDTMNGYTCGPCPPGFSGIRCEKGCNGQVDVTFVLDSSGSIRIERYPVIKEFIVNITKQLNVHQNAVRIGLVYWSDTAAVQFCLNTYNSQQDVINGIRSTPFIGGRTFTASALELMRRGIYQPQCGDRGNARNIAIMVTDGNSNIDERRTLPEAALLREIGTHIMIVAVGRKFTNMAELEGMASAPVSENIYTDVDYSDLQDIVTLISDSTCDDINECASDPCRNGGVCRDDFRRYYCDCPAGFAGYNCGERCSMSMDVVFVLDISGSVEEVYQWTIEFTKEVVYGLDMTFDKTRVGALTYASDFNDNGDFFLNQYPSNKQGVINALNFYHKGGRTNAQAALRAMRTNHFAPSAGDRVGVQNVAIIVSDGYSNVQESNTIPEATEAKRSGIDLYSVALGDNPNMAELNAIASDPDSEHVIRLRDGSDIKRAAEDLLFQLCQ